jgi:hypothetical protein
MTLTLREKTELKNNFDLYATTCLKIVPKSGGLVRFELNQAQRYVHVQLEEMLNTKGYVRALILKGRQQGMSTYIAGRFYHKVTHRMGVSAFVLSHKADTTEMLFNMTRRYHDHMPVLMKPTTKQDSTKALYFDALDSRYSVGTAGGKETGRGGTIHYFHGSEAAFWENDSQHLAGIFQAVPSGKNIKGTEIILESTANGTENQFYKLWMEDNDFIKLFVPWFWQDEYSQMCPQGFEFTEDEKAYQDLWKLNRHQLYWRNRKIKELGDVRLFSQEYPACADDAFLANMNDTFIPHEDVTKALNRELVPHDVYGPLIMGVDVGGMGTDKTAFCLRQGRRVTHLWTYHKLDTMQVVGKVLEAIQKHRPDKVFIDSTGLGVGVVDRLKELGYVTKGLIMGVGFGTTPIKEHMYVNKRAEMWGELREWLHGEVQLPAYKDLALKILAPKYKVDSSGRIQLESKQDMRKRGVMSPDEVDSICLSFAFPVMSPELNIYAREKKVENFAQMSYNELDY